MDRVWDIIYFEMFQPLVSTTGYILVVGLSWWRMLASETWRPSDASDLSRCHPKMVVKSKGSVAKIPETFRLWNYSGYTCPNDSCVIFFL